MEGFEKPAVVLKGKDLCVCFKQNINRQKESDVLGLFVLAATNFYVKILPVSPKHRQWHGCSLLEYLNVNK